MGFLGKIAGGIAGAITGRGGGKGARQQFDVVKGVEGDLGNLFNYGTSTGKANLVSGQGATAQGLQAERAGMNTLSSPLSYWQRIASGNRPAVMSALAPETNAAMKSNDAARRQAFASGTARGGGLAAPMQTQKDDLRAQIDNMLFGVRNQAPGQIAQIGQAQSAIGSDMASHGETAVQQALALLGMGGSALTAKGGLAKGTMDSQAGFTQNTIGSMNQAFGAAGQTDWNHPFKPMPS